MAQPMHVKRRRVEDILQEVEMDAQDEDMGREPKRLATDALRSALMQGDALGLREGEGVTYVPGMDRRADGTLQRQSVLRSDGQLWGPFETRDNQSYGAEWHNALLAIERRIAKSPTQRFLNLYASKTNQPVKVLFDQEKMHSLATQAAQLAHARRLDMNRKIVGAKEKEQQMAALRASRASVMVRIRATRTPAIAASMYPALRRFLDVTGSDSGTLNALLRAQHTIRIMARAAAVYDAMKSDRTGKTAIPLADGDDIRNLCSKIWTAIIDELDAESSEYATAAAVVDSITRNMDDENIIKKLLAGMFVMRLLPPNGSIEPEPSPLEAVVNAVAMIVANLFAGFDLSNDPGQAAIDTAGRQLATAIDALRQRNSTRTTQTKPSGEDMGSLNLAMRALKEIIEGAAAFANGNQGDFTVVDLDVLPAPVKQVYTAITTLLAWRPYMLDSMSSAGDANADALALLTYFMPNNTAHKNDIIAAFVTWTRRETFQWSELLTDPQSGAAYIDMLAETSAAFFGERQQEQRRAAEESSVPVDRAAKSAPLYQTLSSAGYVPYGLMNATVAVTMMALSGVVSESVAYLIGTEPTSVPPPLRGSTPLALPMDDADDTAPSVPRVIYTDPSTATLRSPDVIYSIGNIFDSVPLVTFLSYVPLVNSAVRNHLFALTKYRAALRADAPRAATKAPPAETEPETSELLGEIFPAVYLCDAALLVFEKHQRQLADEQRTLDQLTRDLAEAERVLGNIAAERVPQHGLLNTNDPDSVRDVRESYQQTVTWTQMPEVSGYQLISPNVLGQLEDARITVGDAAPGLRGLPLHVLTTDFESGLAVYFCEYAAVRHARDELAHPSQFGRDKLFAENKRRLFDVAKRLRQFSYTRSGDNYTTFRDGTRMATLFDGADDTTEPMDVVPASRTRSSTATVSLF